MTEPHPESTAATLAALLHNVLDELKIDPRSSRGRRVAGALRDAFELGKLAPTSSAPITIEALEAPQAEGDRAGVLAAVVHTIRPESVAEHGAETVMLAFIRQALRDLATAGAHPERDGVVQMVGMRDGTIVITAESEVGA